MSEGPTPELTETSADAVLRAEPTAAADAALAPIEEAFARGDFHAVRAEARALVIAEASPEVHARAAALVARTEADALAKWLLAIAALTVLLVSAYGYLQGRLPH